MVVVFFSFYVKPWAENTVFEKVVTITTPILQPIPDPCKQVQLTSDVNPCFKNLNKNKNKNKLQLQVK